MSASPINIFEYEALAKERLPQAEYDFIAGGATDEITLRRTRRYLTPLCCARVCSWISVNRTSPPRCWGMRWRFPSW